jgi:myo-inositol-1(or 4)-monophosphatase
MSAPDAGAARVPAAAEVDALVGLAERAARAAGDLIREGRPDQVEVAATKSSRSDVVTAMDHAAEALLRRHLLGERPDDGLLGEEGGLRPGSSGVTWVVDPIDGTVNYLYGLPAFAVSVAAVSGVPDDPTRWQVLAGCVHDVALGQTWTAGLGRGARLDGRAVEVTQARELAQALVSTGFGYQADRRREQAAVVAEVLPRVRDVRRGGSAAIDLCSVACGRLDAHYERGLQPWDMAAASLVVTEAGGRLGGLRGQPADGRMTVAAAPGIFAALSGLLEEVGA